MIPMQNLTIFSEIDNIKLYEDIGTNEKLTIGTKNPSITASY